jgi:Helix-turn-helix domain/Bacterial regulatory proteins, gntR family
MTATAPKYSQVAARIRAQIADGTLKPGSPAPSGAALARATGFAQLTCRKALVLLIREGALRPGPSPNARPRVAGTDPAGPDLAARAAALSGALAARRRAAGLTQAELAALAGCSVTTIGHAETGRLWQSRRFWENADKTLNGGGHLLALHDAYRAAAPPDPTLKEAAMIDVIPTPLADRDPLLLQLLSLATETMLAHPEALPADLIAMLDAYAADLIDARNGEASKAG